MLNIEYIKIDSLIEYENNPRINDMAVEPVAASIREFGFKVPILVDKDSVIIAGHTRISAARLLGMDEVPCIRCEDLTPEQVRAFRLADNKVAELAQWDLSKLEFELSEIEFDMEEFGFTDEDAGMEQPDDIDDFFADRESKKRDHEDAEGAVYRVTVKDQEDEAALLEFLENNGYSYERE